MSSKDSGPYQMADHLGASHGQIDRARELGLLPGPDVDGRRWSAAAVERIRGQWPQILAGIEANREWGAWRCADLLAELTRLDLDGADVEELAARGLVEVSGYYKERPLYRVTDIENLAGHPDCVRVTGDIVLERRAWLAASLPRYEAAKRLGWSVREFEQATGTHGVTPGLFGRYALTDIERLAADELLAEAIRGNRLLGPDQAAEHLEVRRTDFDYCVTAQWITPAGYTDVQVSRRRTVSVPLYRVRDVEALRDIPGVDWEAVRAALTGDRDLAPYSRCIDLNSLLADAQASDTECPDPQPGMDAGPR